MSDQARLDKQLLAERFVKDGLLRFLLRLELWKQPSVAEIVPLVFAFEVGSGAELDLNAITKALQLEVHKAETSTKPFSGLEIKRVMEALRLMHDAWSEVEKARESRRAS